MPSTSKHSKGLRSSCDKCHQSKLKCVSGPKGCQRCEDLHLVCVYSPPGRSGRIPASERSAKEKSMKCPARKIITPPESQASGDEDTFATMESISGEEMGTQRQPTESNNYGTKSDPLSTTLPVDSFFDSMDFMSDNPLVAGIFDTNNMQVPIPVLPVTGPFDKVDFPINDIAKTPEFFDQPTSAMDTIPGIHCTCFHSILRALERVQNPSVRHLGLDGILSSNKSALVDICNSLKCAASHDGTTRLSTLVVLQCTLCLYRLLYQSRLQEKNHGDSDMQQGSSTPYTAASSPWTNSCAAGRKGYFPYSTNALPTTSGNSISKGPLSFGTYQIDQADANSLTKQILLLDLNKVPRLLERLDRRAYGPDESDGLELYNIMRSALITEYRSLLMEATAHL